MSPPDASQRPQLLPLTDSRFDGWSRRLGFTSLRQAASLSTGASPPLQMVMVTERVAASLANVLSGFEGLPPEAQSGASELKMSDLELKHGLLQARLPANVQIACVFHITYAEQRPCACCGGWDEAAMAGRAAQLAGVLGHTATK